MVPSGELRGRITSAGEGPPYRYRASASELSPREEERLRGLLSRSDALNYALAAVEDDEDSSPNIKAECLRVLGEVAQEAPEAFMLYRGEVGIDGVEDVRLIGVDTPETVDPGEEVEPYGPEASSFATRELSGREVELEFDEERIDSYDRLLAYVYTADGRMFNEELVAKGYAQAYPYPPNTAYELRFEQAQRRAKARDLGIWGLPVDQRCLLADRGNGIGEGSATCDLLAEEPASSSATASAEASAPASPSGGGAVPPHLRGRLPGERPHQGQPVRPLPRAGRILLRRHQPRGVLRHRRGCGGRGVRGVLAMTVTTNLRGYRTLRTAGE